MPSKRDRIQRLYQLIPKVECKGLCHEYCGLLRMSRLERKEIVKVAGRAPKTDTEGKCNMLTPEGRCSVYDKRPGICRIWGVVETLKCPHGCVPEGGYLTDTEARVILAAIEQIGGKP